MLLSATTLTREVHSRHLQNKKARDASRAFALSVLIGGIERRGPYLLVANSDPELLHNAESGQSYP